jgi:hypothetical protein
MKLAEALVERSSLKDEIQDLRQRLRRVAKVQEGDTPVEDPRELLATLEEKLRQLERRIVQVNRTNMAAQLADGRTLMEAIAERDLLLLRRSVLEELIGAATPAYDRFSRTEIRYVPTVDVAELQKQADQVAKRYRELDAQIQALNWETELVE